MRVNFLRGRARRDQRGVILVMAVPGFILAVVSLALSVDIGRQVFEKRRDQSVADLASLDAVRDLPNAQAAAEASALRNGFDPAKAGNSIVAERGSVDADRVFTLASSGDAVRVTVSSIVDYIFVSGSKRLTARAVAQLPGSAPPTTTTSSSTTTTTCPPPCTPVVPSAGFTLGSTLASIDTTKAPLLDAVLGKWLKGAAAAGGNADVVGWQGLASSNVTLSALRNHLELLDAGVQFGTVDQMLDADITLAKLAEATANALTASGDTNAAVYAGPAGIIAQSTNTATFKLRKLIDVQLGSENAALATQVNAFQLLTGSAMVANGTNTISVPNIGITIPGLGTTSLSLKVVEAQKTIIGPVGTSGTTSQVELTLTPTLDRPITVAGLVGARLTGTLPFAMTAAGATGTLTAIACPSPTGSVRVAVDLKPFSASTSTTLAVTATVLGAPVTLFSLATTGGLAATDPTPENLDFAYPGEFSPTATGKRAGSSPLGLASLTTFSATATALGLVPVPANLGAVVAGDVNLVVGLLDDNVLAALHRTLGISIGAADVSALKDAITTGCTSPAPPPSTTTTTTTTTTPTTTPPSTAPPSPKLMV